MDIPRPEGVFHGTIELKNMLDVWAIENATEISGDLIISGQGMTAIALPNLQSVQGNVRLLAQTSLTAVNFPALTNIGGDLELNQSVPEMTPAWIISSKSAVISRSIPPLALTRSQH